MLCVELNLATALPVEHFVWPIVGDVLRYCHRAVLADTGGVFLLNYLFGGGSVEASTGRATFTIGSSGMQNVEQRGKLVNSMPKPSLTLPC